MMDSKTVYKRALLLLPGEINVKAIAPMIADCDYIIAVDGGIDKAHLLNITPNVWIGDFDSTTIEDLNQYKSIPKEQFPTDKDLLDTELALEKMYALDISNCLIVGGMGGRIDHQLALFMLPSAHPKIRFTHTDGDVWMQSVQGQTSLTLTPPIGSILSIIPIETLKPVNLSGVKWPLNDATLHKGKGYSVSNQTIESTIQLSVKNGVGWVVVTHNQG